MPQKYANNARAKLAASIASEETSLVVMPGFGDLFPVADAGTNPPSVSNDWFKLFLTDESGEIEIVIVRTRNSGADVMTNIQRAQDGTTARAWVAGAIAYHALSASDVQAIVGSGFGSGTKMLFVQSAAPTGWTKLTNHDDKALRVVSGAAGSGGTKAFSAAFAANKAVSGTVAGRALTLAQIPAHEHPLFAPDSNTQPTDNKVYTGLGYQAGQGRYIVNFWADRYGYNEVKAAAVGSGQSHNHDFSGSVALDVAYVDVIVAQKD